MKRRSWYAAAAAPMIGVLLTAWAWWIERPPAARLGGAPPGVFSAARAAEHLESIAARPHMPGSAEHAAVRRSVVAALDGLGFETEIHRTTVAVSGGRVVRAATVRSIVARLAGSASTGGVALAAHYDSQQLAPGAGDDGAGVAAILEGVRAVLDHGPLRNDLYVVITDAEELGLLGARGFVAEHRWWPEIRVLMSFEARGAAGQSVMFETNADNGWVVREFARADPYPTGSSLLYEIYRRLPNDTDFTIYKRGGVVGLNFAFAEAADAYHRPTDSIANLSLDSLQHHGEHVVATTRHFGGLDLTSTMTAPDVVFFRFPGLGLISYGNGWVLPLTLAAWAFACWVAVGAHRAGRASGAGVVVGIIGCLAAFAIAAGLGWGLWRIVRDAHHELGSIVGRALYDESWYMLAVACFAVAAVGAVFGFLRRWFGIVSLALGAVTVSLVGAAAAAWWAPGVNMLLSWPALFAIGAIRFELSKPRDAHKDLYDVAALAVLAVPVVVMLFPLVWTLYMGLNISVAPVIAIAAVLLLVHLLPLLDGAAQANRWWLPVTAAILGVGWAAAGVALAGPSVARPLPNDLLYGLDRETGEAVWATMQPPGDAWIDGIVDPGASAGNLAGFLAGNPRSYRLDDAPRLDAPAPEVQLIGDTSDGAGRTVRLALRSAMSPELINVSPTGGDWTLSAVNGVSRDVFEQGFGGGGSGDWLLQHWGEPPPGGLILELHNPDVAAPLELVAVELVMRLPLVDGVEIERPAGFVAHAGRLTDVSLFRSTIRF